MVDGSGLMRRVELTEVNMHIEYLEFCEYILTCSTALFGLGLEQCVFSCICQIIQNKSTVICKETDCYT